MSVLDLEVSKAPVKSVKYNMFRSDQVFMALSLCNELAVLPLTCLTVPVESMFTERIQTHLLRLSLSHTAKLSS